MTIAFILMGAIVLFPTRVTAQQDEYRNYFKRIIFDGSYFYATTESAAKVLKLDKRGNVLSELGREGRGPGEFSSTIRLLQNSHSVFIIDSFSNKLSIISKDKFAIDSQRILKDHPFTGINIQNKFHLLRRDIDTFKDSNSKVSGFLIQNIGEQDINLNRFEDTRLNVPFDTKTSVSDGLSSIVFYQRRSSFWVFTDKGITKETVPGIEKLALGKPTTVNHPKRIRWFYKFSPIQSQIDLVKSVVPDHNGDYIFQVKSYQQGHKVFKYGVETNQLNVLGSFLPNRLVGAGTDSLYYLVQDKIKSIPISEISACSDSSIEVYIPAIQKIKGEQIDHLQLLYDEAQKHLISLKFIVENDRWFSSAKQSDFVEIANKFTEWGIWGGIEFLEDCKDCSSETKFKVIENKSSSRLYSIDSNIESIISNLTCLSEKRISRR